MALSPSTTVRDGAGASSRAMGIPARSSIIVHNEHQQGGAVPCSARRLPHSRFQFAGADAPRQRPVRFSSSRRTVHHLPGCAFVAAPGLSFHDAKLALGLVQSHPGQLRSQCVAGVRVIHLSKRLSKPSSSAGSDNASKWRQELGKVIQGRGSIVQGGGRCD